MHDKPAKMDWESMSITVIILVLEKSHHWAVADSDVKYACLFIASEKSVRKRYIHPSDEAAEQETLTCGNHPDTSTLGARSLVRVGESGICGDRGEKGKQILKTKSAKGRTKLAMNIHCRQDNKIDVWAV